MQTFSEIQDTTMKSNLLALQDYAVLKKLAAALWQQDGTDHGAAIMVGAGFSRCAATTGDIESRLPLWNDFSKILKIELGSGSDDPLRLAEEYCAYFGKQSLHDLIKREINDVAWMPGDLHKYLLELPWSEVLTTNWDTLLERASEEVHQPIYNVVAKQEDLSSARSPRIVKLHGTVNISEDLTFTQEDYRRYPQCQAAFVNFARQVFIENELCLLGFSGDDPNFLQWSGWVRDQLASHSRRIYLVGALNLNAAKRKYLESINVAPIDLADLVSDIDDQDAKHFKAASIFVDVLKSLKPTPVWQWKPTELLDNKRTIEDFERSVKDPVYAAKILEQQIPTLESDRKSYPGWLVCPSIQRWMLQTQISGPHPTLKNLAEMRGDSKVKLLYEIAWRQSITHEATDLWLAKEMFQICDPENPCALTKKQQLEVALLLLKSSRWFADDEYRSIGESVSSILEKGLRHWADSANEIAYHRAIVARDNLDYVALEYNTNKISTREAIWKLRKASLLSEMGHFKSGEILVAEAYRELLKQHRQDQSSIYVFSRLAWAHWIMRGIDMSKPHEFKPFPTNYKDQECSPWDHIEFIQEKISKTLEKQRERQNILPSFEPGRYTDNANTVTFGGEIHPLLFLVGITTVVGIPLRWGQVNFLANQAAKLAELEEVEGLQRFSLAIRSANSDDSDVIKKLFSRTQVACLSNTDVEFLFKQSTAAITYWSDIKVTSADQDRVYLLERLRVFIEVLARMSVRLTPENAKQAFLLASSLGKDTQVRHFWIFSALAHLIEFSLKSVPEKEQSELLLEALSFPLPSEVGTDQHHQWPNPVIAYTGDRRQDAALNLRIDEIITSLVPGSSRNASALLRLLPLVKSNFLTIAESEKVSEKIWGVNPEYNEVPETGLYAHVLIELPSFDSAKVRSLVRRYLFRGSKDYPFNQRILTEITNAAIAEDIKEFPSETESIELFNKLLTWKKVEDDDPLKFSKQENRQLSSLIGKTLSRAVIPSFPKSALTEENFEKLHQLYIRLEGSECLPAFVYFAVENNNLALRTEKLIRQSFQMQNANAIAHASWAVLRWRDLESCPIVDRLILKLISLIESNRTIGLSVLLETANEMVDKGYLADPEIELLAEMTPIKFDDADYKNIPPLSRESISVSLIRAACVKLTNNILIKSGINRDELLRIQAEGNIDALPEVRFACSRIS